MSLAVPLPRLLRVDALACLATATLLGAAVAADMPTPRGQPLVPAQAAAVALLAALEARAPGGGAGPRGA